MYKRSFLQVDSKSLNSQIFIVIKWIVNRQRDCFIDLSHFFFEISELNYLYFTAMNAISKTNWPFLFPNSSYIFKIHI
jgi:hypothetical protein